LRKKVNVYDDNYLSELRWDQVLSKISFWDLAFENKIELIIWIFTEYPFLFVLSLFPSKKHDTVMCILLILIVFITVFVANLGAH